MSSSLLRLLFVARLRVFKREKRIQAFTLVELLVTLAIGIFLMASVSSVITTHIRSASTAEISQRVRDGSTRLNYLIQTEASEAATIGQGQPMFASCQAASGVSNSIFNLNIPRPWGTAASPSNVSVVFYYASNGNLRRCGPPILLNGSLDHGSASTTVNPVDALVSPNTTLVTNIACQSQVSTTRQIAFQTTFNDAPGGFQPPCALARAKSFLVTDPTDPAS
ncbi:MAG: PilW family protein [Synechococcus sp.]